MAAYYNEIDPYAAQWVRNLIVAGLVAPGDVDERSIVEVTSNDLRGYDQCHFFAGIAVWSHALRRAGWSDDRPIWTGSCPCQPFSNATRGRGVKDLRHLWPEFSRLIRECRPPVVLGEQVASRAADEWVDSVQADLEGMDYAFGAVAFPAASVGAPHIRERTYWAAYFAGPRPRRGCAGESGASSGMGNSDDDRGGWDDRTIPGEEGETSREVWSQSDRPEPPGPTNGFWAGADWIWCRDGRYRPVEPGTLPLAHGASARVGRLRAYGNALCAEAAVAFIRCLPDPNFLTRDVE